MRARFIAVLTTLTCVTLHPLFFTIAGSTGQIKGRITDAKTGDPVIGASVLIVGTIQGAYTDVDGYYTILRVDPGTYSLRITHVDYKTVEVTDVRVMVDLTTEQDQAMEQKVTEVDEKITVKGRMDILNKFEVSGRVNISQEEISHRPVQTVDQLLERVPRVQLRSNGEVSIRGGRAGEVSYIVDGVPMNDPRGGLGVSGSCQDIRMLGAFPPAHGGTAIVNNEAFDAMFFEHYGVNPFVDTEDDHYSTFAVDIDDASYIMTRSYLERGHLPPKDAVRTEEFINHFDYGYETPHRQAFRLAVEGAPSRFGGKGVWLLRIGIKGAEIRPEQRKAANLVFVVDVSGSMGRENRLGLVRQSLRLLLDELSIEDRVGIVIYGSRGQVLLEPTSIAEKQKIVAAIEALEPEGATNAEEGIKLGYAMASRMFERGKINRVILCSDGVANVGRTGPDQILKEVREYADNGITLSAIGFGMGNFNDVLMEKLGNKGNGHYAYVDDLAEAKRVFVNNLTGTLQVIARDVKIQMDFDQNVVRSYRLIGFENRDVADDKFRDDKEDGGEIGSGHSCTALYELKLHDQAVGRYVGTLFIRFKDPETSAVTEVNHRISRAAFSQAFDRTSDRFRLAAAAAEFAEILRGSYWARQSELSDVLAVAETVYADTADPDVLEFMGLVSKANEFKLSKADD